MFIADWNGFTNAAGSSYNPTSSRGVWTGNMPSEILSQMDRKLDDGNPTTGSFRAAWPGANYGAGCVTGGNAWIITSGSTCGAINIF